jgi:septal ring factor EnvC (AmiA/AmiB activator)
LEEAKKGIETLARAVEEMKKTSDHLSAHVPALEPQVKTLNMTIVDMTTELRAKELSLEHTTTAKDNLLRQNTRLTKKLEGT